MTFSRYFTTHSVKAFIFKGDTAGQGSRYRRKRKEVMEDSEIIELFFRRDEKAIREIEKKYGKLCRSSARRILGDREDAEEVTNDVLLEAWRSIPPENPRSLKAYLCAVCRRRAIDRLRNKNSKKRGSGEYEQSLDELGPVADTLTEDPFESDDLKDAIERFLDGLEPGKRRIFLMRYWWCASIKEILYQTQSAGDCSEERRKGRDKYLFFGRGDIRGRICAMVHSL